MLLVDITIINVALPDIQKQIDASFSDLQWIIDAYALTLASLLLTTGSLADLYGRRKLYMLGLAVFTAASLVCGVATSPLMLIIARGSQGIGGAIMFSVSLALLAGAFSGRERGVAFGVWGSITGLAVAIGPLLGGALTSGLSWRWIFFVNLPLGIAAIALTRAKVSESIQPGARRPDWAGFVTFTAALSLLVFGLIRSGEKGWSSPEVYGCFIGTAVLLALFLVIEARGRSPMLDLGLFRLPTFLGGSIAAFSLSASLFALQLYLVLYLQDVLGYSAFQTGLRLLVLSGGILLTSTIAGRLTAHMPVRFLIGPGLVLVAIGLLLMRRIDPTSDWTRLVIGLFIAGVGTGLVNPPLASTAVGVVHPSRSGMASGINSTCRQVGIATGIATFGSLFASAVGGQVSKGLAGAPPQAAAGLTKAVKNGAGSQAIAALPEQLRPLAAQVARESFVYGLRQILLVAMVVALVGGVLALLLIRSKDFEAARSAPGTPNPPQGTQSPDQPSADAVTEAETIAAGAGAGAGADADADAGAEDEHGHGHEPSREHAEPWLVGAVAHDGDHSGGASENGSGNSSRNGRRPNEAGSVLFGRVEHTDGRPFEGVPLTVTTDDGTSVGLLQSDGDGRYVLPVEPGSYVVVASPSGCQPDARRVAVPADGLGESADFVLDGDGLVYGRVVGARGGVLAVLDHDGHVVAGADIEDDGGYEVGGLRSGSYTFTAVVPGAVPSAHLVEVSPGEAREYDLGVGPADLTDAYLTDDQPNGHQPNGSDATHAADADTRGFSPGLHPVAMVRGGTSISGFPTSPNGSAAAKRGVDDRDAPTPGDDAH
jgi:EmrB/QacA subfamily drug resistance transporter